MTLTAGAITLVTALAQSAVLTATAATGGTNPVAYQWSRSTTTGFTPGAGNRIAGATSLSLTDTGLIPNTVYYYKLEATDSAGSPATVIYTQVAVTTAAATSSQNAFGMAVVAGIVDLRFPTDTVSVVIGSGQATGLVPGSAVKIVDNTSGVPEVIGCTANADDCAGFLNFDGKTTAFVAGQAAEMSMSGNCMYLFATGAIGKGKQVTLDVAAPASVAQAVGSSGAALVGWAYDKAVGHGSLIRVKLTTPGFTKA